MIPNYFNSSKSRASADATESMDQESRNHRPVDSPGNQAWNTGVDESTTADSRPIATDMDEISTDPTPLGNKDNSVMIQHDMFESGNDGNPIFPGSANVHAQSSQQINANTFKAERPMPVAGPTMSPSMMGALLQSYVATPADTNDRYLQASDFMTSAVDKDIDSGDTTMEGTGESQAMQVDASGTADQVKFDIGNDPGSSSLPDLHDVSPANIGMSYPDVLHSLSHKASDSAPNNDESSPVAGDQSRECSQISDSKAGRNASVSGLDANEIIATSNLVNSGTTSSLSNTTGQIIENTGFLTQERSTQAPRTTSADDSVLLADQQRGRLAKYRPLSEDWPLKKRSASVPPRCVDHYSYVANWPPQEPPRCDFGRRVDVFPPRDAPLHLHMQAYALRWGFWTSEIKDKEIRQQILDTVADKMREAWENAVGENYYVRPVVPLDDSDHRNDAEEKTKRGRKRGVSPSKQPAGFICEGRDPLAITNGELAEHNLTMEMINKRVQEKDFDAGEEILDEVLESLDRDRLAIKDWSKFGIHASVHGRNLLMYSLFVVQDCRHERRKLNNLMAKFSKEMQKKNTRARIETHQDREFQHLALASELELARRAENPESQVDEEDQDDDEMETDTADVASQADDGANNPQDNNSAQQSASEDDSISNDQELILQIAQAVLSADSDSALYTAFTEHEKDMAAFAAEGGLRTGDDPNLQAGKLILGEIFESVTRLISLKGMVKRQQDPQEVMKMNYDIKLSHGRILKAQDKLAKALHLDFTRTSGPNTNSAPLGTNQNEAAKVNQMVSNPQDLVNTMMEPHGQPESANTLDDHSRNGQVISLSSNSNPPATSTANDQVSPSQQAVYSSPVTTELSSSIIQTAVPISQNVGINPQNIAFAGGVHSNIQNPIQTAPHSQQAQATQQQTPSNPQAVSPVLPDDAAAKRAYIDEMWRPWLDSELQKRGQPPFQGVIPDWPQLRDIIARLGFTTSDRNQLLRSFKTQFEQWTLKSQVAQHPSIASPSPALSRASLSPVVQTASPTGMPPGWPSNTEIAASIPPNGIHANQLLQKFQHRIGRYVNQFSQLIQQVAFMDQSYVVYPSAQHAAMARQQSTTHQAPVPSSPRPLPAAPKQHQIVKLKLPQNKTAAGLPPPQDESDYPQDYQSTEVNSTRGFSFRHLPHSTLEQRQTIDDMIADYITRTSKGRKKNYYGTYATFNDPQNPSAPPIAHGFWEFKDGTRAEGSEWFYNGEDVPSEWLPKLGVKVDDENEHGAVAQSAPSREVWDAQQGRFVKFKLAGPVQGDTQGRAPSQQDYNTYPPGYGHSFTSPNTRPYNGASTHQSTPQTTAQQPTKQQTGKLTRGRSYLDGQDDEGQDSASAHSGGTRTKKRGGKRGSSAVGGPGGRGSKGSKRRKKNPLADDEDDEDYVPGGE